MSLINDALKKPGNNKINLKGAAPAKAPADSSEPRQGGKGFTVFLVCFVLAGATALGAWNYWNKKYKDGVVADAKNANAAPASTNNNPIARAAAVFNKVLDRNKEGEAAASSLQKGFAGTAASGGSAADGTLAGVKTNANTGVALKPKQRTAWIPGLPRVQAIIFRPEDPIAIIDGKNKRAGDRAGQGLILEVKKDLVLVRLGEDIHEVPVRQ